MLGSEVINAQDANEDTPLTVAAEMGNSDMVKFLLSNNANVDQLRYGKETALMRAALNNKPEVAKILMNASANVTLKNEDGETALDFAKTFSPYIERLLIADVAYVAAAASVAPDSASALAIDVLAPKINAAAAESASLSIDSFVQDETNAGSDMLGSAITALDYYLPHD